MTEKNKVSKQDQHIINRVAEGYGFTVRFDKELDKWIIEGGRRYGCHNFYWSSNETFEQFFQDVKDFFEEEAIERYR